MVQSFELVANQQIYIISYYMIFQLPNVNDANWCSSITLFKKVTWNPTFNSFIWQKPVYLFSHFLKWNGFFKQRKPPRTSIIKITLNQRIDENQNVICVNCLPLSTGLIFRALTLLYFMLKNSKTYFKNLALFTLQDF